MVRTRIRTLFRHPGSEKLRYLNNIYLKWRGPVGFPQFLECVSLQQQEDKKLNSTCFPADHCAEDILLS